MQPNLPGEYFIQNVREMASGFLLKPDQTFQFFFTYGALDRFASGQWKQEGDKVILESRPWSGADFLLLESRPGRAGEEEEEGIVIQLDPPNPMLAAYLQVSLSGGAPDSWIQFRQHGYLHLPPQEFDSVSLFFEFCPERFTKLPVPAGHTVLTIRPQESLFELYLQRFELSMDPEGLKGRHPVLEGEFVYGRNSQ